MTTPAIDPPIYETKEFLSAVCGGLFVLAGTWLAYLFDRCERKREASEDVNRIVQALHDEISTLWKRYEETIGPALCAVPNDKAFEGYYPVSQDYFTIYNNNTSAIGKIKDHDLRKQIVLTYTQARGIIDSFRMNNSFVQRYEQAVELFNQTKNADHLVTVKARYDVLVDYAQKLKLQHNELKDSVAAFIQKSENYLKCSMD